MIRIRFTKPGVVGIGRRELQKVGAAAMYPVGLFWLKKYLPLHFMDTAFPRYGYQHRGSRYNQSKKDRAMGSDGIRAIGEDLPLVFTGRTRESAERGSHLKTTATNYRTYNVYITMPTPQLNRQPWLREELKRVIPVEERQMEKVFDKEFERQLNRVGRTKKTTKTYKASA